jgi:Vault protein inter-alpha-trypsin domain/von Willebrand factor type A domain
MPEALAVAKTGLLTVEKSEKAPAAIPLEGVRIEAEVRDFCARVTVDQRYRNTEHQPLEAVYVFPLDEGAAVCGFEAMIDGAHVVGRVKEREQAFAEYDDALAAGHGAYLLDQERPDIFTASIGNLPPGKEVLVRIRYVAELPRDGDDIRFTLPTTVSPRYAPAEDQRGVGRTPAEALNPPVAFSVPYGLELEVKLDMACRMSALESPSHPVSVETEAEGRRARVRLGERLAALDRDFVLKVRLAEPGKPRTSVETDASGRTAALLAFEPRFAAGETPGEYVFLVDRSGSMGGPSIAEARNALQLCLRGLRGGSFFNIVSFGSRFEAVFGESRPYDEDSLAEATRAVAAIDADFGGTEIHSALEWILTRPLRPGLARQLFVLTDGQVTNTEAVIALVRKHSEETRLFAFGIGAGASAHLVRGIARAGEGEAEFIAPGERTEDKVTRQLKRAFAPALTDVEVDWGGLRVTQAPHRLPPVFAGGRLLVYGFLEDAKPAEVTLRGTGPDGPVSFPLRLDPAEAPSGTLLATLAARTAIRDLEEGRSTLHDRRGSLQERDGKAKDRVIQEIVRLGVTYGLVSRHTSYVAVEERVTPVQGDAVLRRVPVALTRGWGGLEDGIVMRTGAAGRMAHAVTLASVDEASGFDVRFADALPGTVAAPRAAYAKHTESRQSEPTLGRRLLRRLGLSAEAAEGIASGRGSSEGAVDRLVTLQRADGSWELSQELAAVLGRNLAELEGAIPLGTTGGNPRAVRRAWATATALAWLERQAAGSERFEMMAEKAREWLAHGPVLPPGADWVSRARDFLR